MAVTAPERYKFWALILDVILAVFAVTLSVKYPEPEAVILPSNLIWLLKYEEPFTCNVSVLLKYVEEFIIIFPSSSIIILFEPLVAIPNILIPGEKIPVSESFLKLKEGSSTIARSIIIFETCFGQTYPNSTKPSYRPIYFTPKVSALPELFTIVKLIGPIKDADEAVLNCKIVFLIHPLFAVV